MNDEIIKLAELIRKLSDGDYDTSRSGLDEEVNEYSSPLPNKVMS